MPIFCLSTPGCYRSPYPDVRNSYFLPVNLLNTFALEESIRLAEVFTAEETMVSRAWRRMHGCQHQVFMGVDKGDLLFCITSPQHEYQILTSIAQFLYHCICKSFPSHIPGSLANIFKEIHQDLGKPIPTSGNLDRWVEQGVFSMNSVLTVRAHETGSHRNMGWETFTDAVIKKLSDGQALKIWKIWCPGGSTWALLYSFLTNVTNCSKYGLSNSS